MANYSRLKNWISANHAKLDLEVRRITWTDSWLQGYWDFELSISVDGQRFEGRGLGKSDVEAFEKAGAECLERAAVGLSRQTVLTGVAAHYEFHQASKKAYLELLEFDRAFCHHYSTTPLKEASIDSFESSLLLKKKLEELQLSLRVFEMKPVRDARLSFAIIRSIAPTESIKGFVGGFGSGTTSAEAIEHAVLECLREAVAVFEGRQTNFDVQALKSSSDPQWHFVKALDKEQLDFVEANLLNSPNASLVPEDLDMSSIDFNRIDSLDNIFPDLPLSIVYATSDRLALPQFGEGKILDQNLDRLRNFGGSFLHTKVPHFYG